MNLFVGSYVLCCAWPFCRDLLLRLRPGNVVIFSLPGCSGKTAVEVGFVVSIWKGAKAPKLTSSECSIQTCSAFRAVAMNLEATEDRFRVAHGTIARFRHLQGICHM